MPVPGAASASSLIALGTFRRARFDIEQNDIIGARSDRMQCVFKRIGCGNGECILRFLQQSYMDETLDFAAPNEQDPNYRFRRHSGPATFNGDLHASAHAYGVLADANAIPRMRSFALA